MGKKAKFNRFTAMTTVMTMLFSLLFLRLTYIQVINVDEYKGATRCNVKSIA